MSNYSKNLKSRIAVLILAAGAGGRIGMPKWQMLVDGKTFLDIICDKLASACLTDVICIKRKEFEIRNPSLKYVTNPTPEYGMISSVYYGVKAYSNYAAYLIWPVDHPFVEGSTIVELRDIFGDDQGKVIRPMYNGTPGHPIIIPNSLITYLKTPDYSGGLRQLVRDSKTEILDITVNDSNILKNVNLITDLELN